MKRVVQTVCALCAVGTALAAAEGAAFESLLNARSAMRKAGFVSLKCDTTEYGFDDERDPTSAYAALMGNARLETTRLVFRADRILFVYYLKAKHLSLMHPFVLYAEGNVIVGPGRDYEHGPRPFLTADAFYYDGRTLQGLAVNSRLRVTQLRSAAGDDIPDRLAMFARELRFRGHSDDLARASGKARVRFGFFEGRDITVSACDLSPPHWGLKCASLVAEEEEEDPGEYMIYTGGTYLAVAEHRVLPLPPLSLSTRHFKSIPLRRVRVSTSSRFGYALQTTWDAGSVPGMHALVHGFKRTTGVPLEIDAQIDGMTRRGVGLGTEIRYGRKPRRWQSASWRNVAGEFRFYGIKDTGEDRNEQKLFGSRTPEEWRKDSRYRLRFFHRMETPSLGSVDAEVSLWRDRNFYREFFKRELYGERPPETYVLYRRELGSAALASVMYKPRVNAFQSHTEYLPEGSVTLYPVRMTDTIGPTFEGQVRAGNLRILPDAEFKPPIGSEPAVESFRTGRYHAEGTAALPLGMGHVLRVRPFYGVKGTVYEHRWQGGGSAERLIQVGGATASTQLWRNIPLAVPLLGIERLRHVIVPHVTYSHAFFSSEDHAQFYRFDGIDALDKLEYLELAVATYLLGRRAGVRVDDTRAVERLLELRARARYYPRASRDHLSEGSGRPRNWSNVYLNLFSDILMRNVTVGVEAEIDTERGKGFAVLNPYVRLRVPGVLQLTVGELFTTGDRRINRAESNYFWADVYWYLSDTYTLDAYCRYDFARKSLGRQYVGLSRAFDCFTLQTGVEYDKIDNDVRWTVHVYPSGYDRRNR